MAYRVQQIRDDYAPRKGLEGPFRYPNGRVVYYDAKAGQYWDPKTDFYLDQDELLLLNGLIFEALTNR